MYKIKAIEGNVDMAEFDLSDVINSANKEAASVEEHNRRVLRNFIDLVADYVEKANAKLDSLGLPPFDYRDSMEIYIAGNGIKWEERFGHGRGSITLYFSADLLDCGRVSTDFKGEISVRKNWKGYLESARYTYPLESVADIFDKGKDVIKFHIINIAIEDHRQKKEALKVIDYTPN